MATKESGEGGRKRDWRRPGAKGATNAPAWKEGGAAAPPSRRWGGLKRWSVTLLAMAAFAALIWWLIPTKRTALVIFSVSGYDDPLPPNAWAREDADRLREQFSDAGKLPWKRPALLATAPADFSGGKDAALDYLAQRLREAAAGRLDNTIVLYLSAHGVVDSQNEACLIVNAANPGREEDWLRISDLLDWLHGKGPAAASLEENSRFVLLLDAHRLPANIGLGILENTFAERLAQAVNRKAGANVAVIGAAGPGQVSWSSPKLEGTAFGYLACRALAGEADDNGDEKISLGELATYLRRRVDDWAQTYRFDRQQPVLLPERLPAAFEKDPTLARLGGETAVKIEIDDESLAEEREAFRKQAEVLWTEHERLAPAQRATDRWTAKHHRLLAEQALAWEQVQHDLVRWEELFWSGAEYRAKADDLRVDLEKSLQKLANPTRLRGAPHGVSLAEAVGGPPEPNKTVEDAIDLLGRGGDLPEKDRALVLRALAAPYEQRAALAWQRVRKSDFDFARAERLWKELVSPVAQGAAAPTHFVEWQFVRMLAFAGNLPESVRARGDLLAAALRLRDQAERAAAPGDERLAPMLQPRVDPLDQRRRPIEDGLFVGQDLGGLESEQRALADAYAAVLRDGDRLSAALAARDRAYAWLPHYIAWSGRHASQVQPESSRLPLAKAAIEDLRALEEGLATAPPDLAAVEKSLAPLERSLAALYGAFAAALPKGGDDASFARRAHDSLATPLISGKSRAKLRDDWLDALHEQGDDPSDGQGPGAANPPPVPFPGGSHPIVAWLELPDNDQDSGRGRWRADGQAVREWLAAVPKPAETPGRVALAALDTRLRRGAAWWAPLRNVVDKKLRDEIRGPVAKSKTDANDLTFARLTNYDRGWLWHWQARRAFADYWGSGEVGVREGYFQAVIADYAAAVGGLAPELAADWGAISQQAAQFDARQDVTAVESAHAQSEAPPVNQGRLTMNWRQQDVQVPAVAAGGDFGGGKAAVFARAAGGGVAFSLEEPTVGERMARPAPHADAANPWSVTLAGLPDAAADCELVTFFRGHVAVKPFLAQPPETPLVRTFARQKLDKPRVRVRGEKKDPGVILFVLDCSGSMGPSKDNNFSNRMPIAIGYLQQVLADLSEADGYKVGLCFYGHRARFQRVDGVDAYRTNVPGARIRPSEDFELVQPIGELSPQTLDDFRTIVGRAAPYGETPLYYSMVEAIKLLQGRDKSAPRQLVVITDGENQSYPGKQVDDDVELRYSTETIEAAVRNSFDKDDANRIKVFMVGFDLSTPGAVALQNLVTKDLAGKYAKATSSGSELLEKLREALGVREYAIARGDGPDIDRPRVIGQWYERPAFAETFAGDYWVRLKPQGGKEMPIRLEGGEWVELYSLDEGRELVAERYRADGDPDEKTNSRDDLPNPDHDVGQLVSPERLRAAWHPPQRPNANIPDATFFVSVQNDDPAAFSPRPRESWIEISPVDDDDRPQGLAYQFPEPTYALGLSAPVLECKCPDWPQLATRARIRVWCRMRATDDGDYDAFPIKIEPGQGNPLRAGNEVRIEVRGFNRQDGSRGAVVEVEQTTLLPLRVEIPYFSATRIVREYYPKGQRIVHRFEFGSEVRFEQLIEKNAVVRVLPRDAWEQNAAQADLPPVRARD